jgi:ABC-type lipoprotein release transport system permease subunit
MKLYLRLAWRNIWRHSRRTLIVIVAMSSGLILMMMYDGLVSGFEQAIYGNAIRVLGGNIQVHAAGYQANSGTNPLLPLPDEGTILAAARAQPQVVSASRRIVTGGLATSREGAFAVQIVGIEPDLEAPVNLVLQNVKAGRALAPDDQDMALIGKALADSMDLKVGDRFTLAGRAAHEQMRQRTMTVVGIYDIGMSDIEKQTVYLALSEAETLYGLPGQATEVIITLKDIGHEAAVMAPLRSKLSGIEVSSWQTNFPELEATIGTKGAVMTIFGIVILGIAGIGILNLLLMAVYERTREIGLLGALGFRPRQIWLLFLLEGTMMGLAGAVVGIVVGLFIMVILSRIGFDYSAFSGLASYTALISGRVYPTLGLEKLPMRTLTVLIISALAALIPAREASQREPAEALHFV